MTRRTFLLVLFGLALAVGGTLVALRPRPLGWVAYTPLSEAVFSPGLIVLDAVGWAALAVAAVGLALVAGVVGYLLGRRAPARPDAG